MTVQRNLCMNKISTLSPITKLAKDVEDEPFITLANNRSCCLGRHYSYLILLINQTPLIYRASSHIMLVKLGENVLMAKTANIGPFDIFFYYLLLG